MGFLDDMKGKLEDLGEKAGEAFDAAKDKASDLIDDVKERVSGDEPAVDDQVTPAEDVLPEASEVPPAPTEVPGEAGADLPGGEVADSVGTVPDPVVGGGPVAAEDPFDPPATADDLAAVQEQADEIRSQPDSD